MAHSDSDAPDVNPEQLEALGAIAGAIGRPRIAMRESPSLTGSRSAARAADDVRDVLAELPRRADREPVVGVGHGR